MGSIVKRGGKFSIVYRDLDNKQCWKSGFDTERDAQLALFSVEDDIQNNIKYIGENFTLIEFLRMWLEEHKKNISLNTYNGYRVNIENHILTTPVANKLLSKLDSTDFIHLFRKLEEKGLSSTSMLYVYNTLSKSFTYAIRYRYIKESPLKYVERPKKKRYKGHPLNQRQTQQLVDACKGYHNQVAGTALIMLVMFGLRRGELLALCKEDIDVDVPCLYISKTVTFYSDGYKISDVKTPLSNRTLLMSDTVKSYLIDYMESVNSKYLFLDSLTGSSLTYHFKQILKKCDLPNVRLHDLRHTYATMLLLKNIPVKIVSARLGHSSTSITNDIYSHVLVDMQKPAVDVMDFLI